MIPDSPYANFVRLGRYKAAEEWRLALETLKKDKPDCWDIFNERGGQARIHQHTRHFPIIWNEVPSSLYSYFEHLLKPLQEKLTGFYGEGFFRKLIITNQQPKSTIYPHIDSEALFRNCHRCHLSLYTGNTKNYGRVLFSIGYMDLEDHTRFKTEITKRWIAEIVAMCADELWEINNSPKDRNLRHSVLNGSYDEDKIHVIMDWRPENFVSSFGKKELDKDRETIV